MIDSVVLIELVLALSAIGAFVFFYGTRPVRGTRFRRQPTVAWTSTPIGVVLMAQKIALFTVLSFVLLSRFVGEFPGRDIIALVLYSLLVLLFWAVFGVLRFIQLPFEREQRQKSEPPDSGDYTPDDYT